MAKRSSNVREISRNSSDSEVNCSDVENDLSYQPVNKRRCNYATRQNYALRRNEKRQNFAPKEEDEHTYSSTPIFSNMRLNREQSDDSTFDSDYEDSKSAKVSKRSISSDSISERTKGKFIPSDDEHERKNSSKRRPKCFSKNAVMARVNRQRKKEYVEKLESDVDNLKEKNNVLKSKFDEQTQLVVKLKNEIRYLRSALSHSKEIGTLLRRICGDSSESRVNSSLLLTPPTYTRETLSSVVTPPPDQELKSVAQFDEDNDSLWPRSQFDTPLDHIDGLESSATLSTEREQDPFESIGFCLHVSKNQLSFEFCEVCSQNALLQVLGSEELPTVK